MLKLPEIQDITNQLPKHPTKRWPVRTVESIKLSVQHHTASEAPLKNQALYHINHHNWAGLAYTFVIDRGNIYQTNDLASMTSHALGVNPFSVGICVNGDLSKRPLSDFERKAITALHITLRDLLQDVEVMGHNEASWKFARHGTSCPCTDMKRIRNDILDLEEKIDFQSQKSHDAAEAFKFATRVKDLQHKLSGTRWASEGARKLMKLKPVAADLGFAEGEEVTAELIAKKIIDMYHASAAAKFEDIGFEHLMKVVQYGKTVGLL